jgi:hypothetical protein
MDLRLVTGLVAGVLLLGVIGLEQHWEGGGGFPEVYATGPEARAWLARSENESALASNRFGDTINAKNFVRQLYNAGAERVIVPDACITEDDVEIYADGLVVTLPTDPTKRASVWRICAAELAREGVKAEDDGKENRVFLWWD